MANFHELKEGDKFHIGKARGMGINSNVIYYMIYQKVSKSKALCVDQIGYGNTRGVGTYQSFGPFATVYKLEE